MIVTRYGIDPDPKAVEVRMAALAAEGLTPESFGVTDSQLRHHLDPSRSGELRELIKIDPIRRGRLSKFLPKNHPARPLSANGHAATALKDAPQTRGAPAEAKTPRQEIDPAQIDGAIQRVVDAGNGGRDNASGTRQGRQPDRLKPETFLVKASEIVPEPIAWLWKYWLARGKLHIIAGAPGGGKTTIYLSFAAIISSGATWPDGTRAQPGNVLIWTSEDGHADTIIPRLTRMGANLDRIFIVRSQREANGKTRAFNPSTDMASLREKAATISGGVDFVFLDPVVSVVPVTRNSDKNAEARAGLTPFVDFAIELNAAAGGVTHVSKWTSGKDPLERVTGTLDYGAVPRIVLLTSVNKAEGDGEPERVMVRVKNNIGPCDGGFGFHIDTATLLERPDVEATRIVWELPLEGTAIELMNAAEGETVKVSKLDEAKRFLKAALAKGERPADEIKASAAAQNISWGTLKRASVGEVIKRKTGYGDGWVWVLA
jgi:putative DNA primase/helicase